MKNYEPKIIKPKHTLWCKIRHFITPSTFRIGCCKKNPIKFMEFTDRVCWSKFEEEHEAITYEEFRKIIKKMQDNLNQKPPR